MSTHRTFPEVPIVRGDTRVMAMEIRCIVCGAVDYFPHQTGAKRKPPVAAQQNFQAKGWSVGNGPRKDFCPLHAAPSSRKEKDMTGSILPNSSLPGSTSIPANSYVKRPGGAAPLGLLAPVLTYAQQGGSSRPMDGQAHTITASGKDQNAMFCGYMAQANNDSRRHGGVNPGRSLDDASSTITQTGSHQQLVSAYVARDFGTSTGHAVDVPAATVMPEGQGKSRLIMPYLQSYYGTGEGCREDGAGHTVTTRDRFGHIEATIDVPPFTEAQAGRARQVADFLRAHGVWDEREFVTIDIDGVTFVVVDIGMRMLTPRELYNAQGFPRDYRIDGYFDKTRIGHNGGPVWVPFSKEVQVSCVGNSVCPPVARALVAANCNHLAVKAVAA